MGKSEEETYKIDLLIDVVSDIRTKAETMYDKDYVSKKPKYTKFFYFLFAAEEEGRFGKELWGKHEAVFILPRWQRMVCWIFTNAGRFCLIWNYGRCSHSLTTNFPIFEEFEWFFLKIWEFTQDEAAFCLWQCNQVAPQCQSCSMGTWRYGKSFGKIDFL